MFKFFNKESCFTIIELIISITIISFWIIWVLTSISFWTVNIEKIRKEIIAINIAREWMEAVYNIRDTNWLRWSWKKEYCWLKTNPLVDNWNDWCENDPWMSWNNYVISWQTFFTLHPIEWDLNLNDWINNSEMNYIMCIDNNYWYNCPWQNWYNKQWAYFRQIKWVWLYDKNTNSLLNCENWISWTCWLNTAKEYRFCSIVFYQWSLLWKVELCWIITNFN